MAPYGGRHTAHTAHQRSRRRTVSDPLQLFFYPDGVVVIGASSNPNKLSYGVLHNLATHGYQGPIYPVNPKGGEIL
ncbi:MAG: CoA-binding protein, partial [Chloroflexota bacterium]|nr:CoA-binding protein [Chloroflexota bacterium]